MPDTYNIWHGPDPPLQMPVRHTSPTQYVDMTMEELVAEMAKTGRGHPELPDNRGMKPQHVDQRDDR